MSSLHSHQYRYYNPERSDADVRVDGERIRQSLHEPTNPSLSAQIDADGYIWLPVKSSAFQQGIAMPTWPDDKIRLGTGYATVREFYESIGIQIEEPYPQCEFDGWYHCKMPADWQAEACSVGNVLSGTVFLNEIDNPQFFISSTRPFVHNISANPDFLKAVINSSRYRIPWPYR